VSRNEGRIEGVSEVEAEVADILAALAKEANGTAIRRQDAVTRYLSASDGWQQASAALGGAFAARDQGSMPTKDE
jgi:hypothetical protein